MQLTFTVKHNQRQNLPSENSNRCSFDICRMLSKCLACLDSAIYERSQHNTRSSDACTETPRTTLKGLAHVHTRSVQSALARQRSQVWVADHSNSSHRTNYSIRYSYNSTSSSSSSSFEMADRVPADGMRRCRTQLMGKVEVGPIILHTGPD